METVHDLFYMSLVNNTQYCRRHIRILCKVYLFELLTEQLQTMTKPAINHGLLVQCTTRAKGENGKRQKHKQEDFIVSEICNEQFAELKY